MVELSYIIAVKLKLCSRCIMCNNLGRGSDVKFWSTFSLSRPHYEYLVKWVCSHTKMQPFAALESLWTRPAECAVVLIHTFLSPFPSLYWWSANMIWCVQLQKHGCNQTGGHGIFSSDRSSDRQSWNALGTKPVPAIFGCMLDLPYYERKDWALLIWSHFKGSSLQ